MIGRRKHNEQEKGDSCEKKWVKEQTINHTQGKGGVSGDRDTYNGACALCSN